MENIRKQHSLPHLDLSRTGSRLLGSLKEKWGGNAPYHKPNGIITEGEMNDLRFYVRYQHDDTATAILKEIFKAHAGSTPQQVLQRMTEELRANPRIANAFVTRFEKEMSQDVS